VVLDMGAGASLTMAGLWPPGPTRLRYVATDLSLEALREGCRHLGGAGAAVQCEAGGWPFAEESADVVLVFGVLHHVPRWRDALRRACASVRPGGFVLLHEVVEKPRVGGRLRRKGVADDWSSPHEGSVSGADLRAILDAEGSLVRWRGEASPLRFALVHYLDLHVRLERSRALTILVDLLDQAFGRSLGRLFPSLGFGEVSCLWRRPV
jgi:SAM-dependent methyltransferase